LRSSIISYLVGLNSHRLRLESYFMHSQKLNMFLEHFIVLVISDSVGAVFCFILIKDRNYRIV